MSARELPPPESEASVIEDLLVEAYQSGHEPKAYRCRQCGCLFTAGSYHDHLGRAHPGVTP